jgi:hypothetical protein
MERVIMPALVLAVACSNNNAAGNGREDIDWYIPEAPQDLWEPEAPEELRPDVFPDGTDDPGPDDSGQEIPICPDADSETVELVPIPPSRPAMDCGPSCRQVSFAESAVWEWIVGIWEDRLVFSSGATGPTPDIDRIWLVDLTNLNHYIISETDYSALNKPISRIVDIYRDIIVWDFSEKLDEDLRCHYIMRFNLSTCTIDSVWQRNFESKGPKDLKIHGDHLAWWDSRDVVAWGGQAFLYDMETGEERLLSPDGCCASFVMMDGNWVVWEQGIPGNGIQIWIHDIERSESRPLTSGRLDKYSAYVLGDKVAWAECVVDGCTKYDGLSADIMMMDVVTGEITPITNDTHAQSTPVLGDGIIAWADCRNDPENSAECWNRKSDVYLKNLDTGEESRLTNVPNNALPAVIWGNKLFFLTRDLDDILSVFEITL